MTKRKADTRPAPIEALTVAHEIPQPVVTLEAETRVQVATMAATLRALPPTVPDADRVAEYDLAVDDSRALRREIGENRKDLARPIRKLLDELLAAERSATNELEDLEKPLRFALHEWNQAERKRVREEEERLFLEKLEREREAAAKAAEARRKETEAAEFDRAFATPPDVIEDLEDEGELVENFDSPKPLEQIPDLGPGLPSSKPPAEAIPDDAIEKLSPASTLSKSTTSRREWYLHVEDDTKVPEKVKGAVLWTRLLDGKRILALLEAGIKIPSCQRLERTIPVKKRGRKS